MIKGARIFVAIILLSVLFSGLSIASFSYKNSDIEKNYSLGDNIKGMIGISFNSEMADSLFTSNFNGNISLIDLLYANQFVEGEDYSCTYPGCVSAYNDAGAIGTTNVSLNKEQLVAGFKIIGEDITISSLTFSVKSNAGNSCSRQMVIDVLGKGESFIQSNKHTNNNCGDKNNGCFNSGTSNTQAIIGKDNLYCEKVVLGSAPAYKLGAVITNGTSQDSLMMNLLDSYGNALDNCILPQQTIQTQELSCTVNYTITNTDNYFVCVNSYSDESKYKILSETRSPVCGSVNGLTPFTTDFDLFAQPLEFAAIGSFDINENSFTSQNSQIGISLADYTDSYLLERYNRDCSKGCFIPFIFSGIPQDLEFENAEIVFRRNGVSTVENTLHKLEIDKSKISSDKQLNLQIEPAEFKISGNQSEFYLYLNGIAIFTEPIKISIAPSFEFDITPKKAMVGAKTNFQAMTPVKITRSNWDFGDGEVATSNGATISHRYTLYDPNGYHVEVELTGADGTKAKKSFDIPLGNLSDSAKALIKEYSGFIENAGKKIENFSEFVSKSLRERINLSEMQNSISLARKNLESAATDEDYLDIVNEALSINPPSSLEISERGKEIPLEFGFENIDASYIEQISGDNNNYELNKAISSWFEKNYNANIDYETISATDDSGESIPVLTDYKIIITKKQGADESANDAYLIINYPKESVLFAEDYAEKSVGSGVYLPISDSKNIEFLIYENAGISTLGAYISPKIEVLSSMGALEIVGREGFKWGRFILWISVLLAVALGAYSAMQQWYKKRYESHLFKNPADINNVITFVYNSRKSGLDDSEISKKLKKAGWSGEQTTYAFRKLDGKRTGLPEIPIFRLFEKKKIMKEIEMRREASQQNKNI